MSTVNLEPMKLIEPIDKEKDKELSFNKLAKRISPNDVYWCNLGDVHDQFNKYMIKKVRPCIILSDDTDDLRKDIFTVLPIKSYKGDYENMYFITKKIELGDIESLVCLDQIRPLNRRSIFDYIGTLVPSQRQQVDEYLEEYLTMNRRYKRLQMIMDEVGITLEDVEQIILSTVEEYKLSCNTDDEVPPSQEACRPFNLSAINMK